MTGCGAIAALTAAPTEPTKVLVSGGIGTGKTSALATLRSALRDAGVPVFSRPPRPGEANDAAVVVDDAHLLDDDELHRLTELVGEPRSTVVIACQPLAHHATLTELTTAIARENPAVLLGPLPGKDLLRAASEALGAVPPAELGRALMASTSGLPFLLYPAIEAARLAEGDAPVAAVHAARVALVERLVRVAEPVLDTLLLCSLSPELGPDDVAAALRVDSGVAGALVDQARATGLLSPSHNQTFLRSLHRSLAQAVGTARHHDVEASLLHSQQEMSTLSTDLALRLAEHGLRDSGLADELATRAALGRGDPGQTARLYRAAAEAGATTLTARLADALAMIGDCATAGRLADDLLSSEDPAERATAVRIAASIAMHDGGATQAADLFRWLGPPSDTHVAAASAVVSVATGDPSSARAALELDVAGPPTSTARAARSLAEGMLLTLDRPYSAAMARLSQSITDQVRRASHPTRRRRSSPSSRSTAAIPRGPAASSLARCARQATTRASSRTGTDCCWAGCACWKANSPDAWQSLCCPSQASRRWLDFLENSICLVPRYMLAQITRFCGSSFLDSLAVSSPSIITFLC